VADLSGCAVSLLARPLAGKRYFTWDKNEFPNPKKMIEHVAAKGRKMVTIVDPHIKRDANYHVHKEATEKGLYIKDKTGKDFDGWCWYGARKRPCLRDAVTGQCIAGAGA
jgi:alpha-glucosidase (family GH31 glycosyl hydrolase)